MERPRGIERFNFYAAHPKKVPGTYDFFDMYSGKVVTFSERAKVKSIQISISIIKK